MATKTKTTANHKWTARQLEWLGDCELMGAEFYAAFRKRFKIKPEQLSNQAIRGRRIAIWKKNGWM